MNFLVHISSLAFREKERSLDSRPLFNHYVFPNVSEKEDCRQLFGPRLLTEEDERSALPSLQSGLINTGILRINGLKDGLDYVFYSALRICMPFTKASNFALSCSRLLLTALKLIIAIVVPWIPTPSGEYAATKPGIV